MFAYFEKKNCLTLPWTDLVFCLQSPYIEVTPGGGLRLNMIQSEWLGEDRAKSSYI